MSIAQWTSPDGIVANPQEGVQLHPHLTGRVRGAPPLLPSLDHFSLASLNVRAIIQDLAPLDGARRLVQAGNSVLPVALDGSKRPALTWKPYQARHPTDAELVAWFGWGQHGPGVICGTISGEREVIDLDDATLLHPFAQAVMEIAPTAGLDGRRLLASLVVVATPRPGYQLHYRLDRDRVVEGNQPLARVPKVPTEEEPGHYKTVIETRGEGGYCLTPYAPPACHPKGERYRLLQGNFDAPAVIDPIARLVLLEAAQGFNTYVPPQVVTGALDGSGASPRTRVDRAADVGDRPGDHFNQQAPWTSLLEPAGWKAVAHHGDTIFWQRPGKQGRGGSATTNYAGSDLFYVFSSNAPPFEPDTAYSKFAVYALLVHDGDWGEAARALGALGYGRQLAHAGHVGLGGVRR